MDHKSNNSCSFNEITFGAKRFQQSIESHKEILEKFYVGFEQAKILKGDAKIFLDTNVLLKSYNTSFKAREKLLQFFRDYKSRIILTAQVQLEYVKNRENVITKFSEDVTQIQQKFKGDIAGAVTQFSSNYKIILTDYPAIQTELSKLSKHEIFKSHLILYGI